MPRFQRRLRCSSCTWSSPLDHLANLCPDCSLPLIVEYDLSPATELRSAIRARQCDTSRYIELLPFDDVSELLGLGEGCTPLLPAPSLRALADVRIKDESKNPTRSFKARGMAVAVSMAKKLGARSLGAPTAGNAGCALAAYGARARMPVFVAMPRDTPRSIFDEASVYGAEVQLVDGVITDCARVVQAHLAVSGGFELSTLREPYRVEGKKLMGYELLDDLGRLPDVILYPTGGGTGLIGMWKAFDEMERLGWIDSRRPRLWSVQAEGCAPIVRAMEQGLDTAPAWENPVTAAWGLRVPKAIGDRLMLRALRASGGGAIAVPEDAIEPAAARIRRQEGIDAGPETGAALLALERLVETRLVRDDETVVLFNTGANKYI
ncbi:MAG: threonine synthase [Acidobacteria bacterium]|nr:threonine synthase [Acidobacteriota bacterium]